ncbi:chemocyanin-like [Zingiber officinale]|uniref:chemocyanin-like n=1 Tax=Zingiber officinale TaxID=94328 RepID=UPI001C4BF18C|nr:chemocyanin-like [Zingiber officinale]
MAQGSGSAGGATRALGLGTLLCLLLLLAHTADAATYTVGDSGGWTFNMASWTRGKRFRAGDVLVFRYSRSVHNVVPVSAAGYNGCSAPRGSRTYNSGNDRITLARGRNYFICSIAGHCQSGMKIAVVAA